MTYFHIPTVPISFLFLLFLSLSPFTSAEFLRDYYSGKPLINGGSYVISRKDPAPDEGSIVWANSSNSKPCPLYVLQSYFPITSTSSLTQQLQPDNSITIRSPLRSRYIPLNAPIEIIFNDKNTPCKKPLKWSVKPAKPLNAYYLVAGYYNPRYKGYFKVIDAKSGENNVYRLVYCLNREQCLEVGNASKFPRRGIFGITSDPQSINFWSIDFHISKP